MRLIVEAAPPLKFAFSPIRETLRAIGVLLAPAAHPEQASWIRAAHPALDRDLRAEMGLFRFFFSPPELFPFAWKDSGTANAAREIAALAARPRAFREALLRRLSGARLITRAELRRLDFESLVARQPSPQPLFALYRDDPAAVLARFCEFLSVFHGRIVEPRFGPIQRLLEADIARRRKILECHGRFALFKTLAPDLAVEKLGDQVAIDLPHGQGEHRLAAGADIALTPSFFTWPHTQILFLMTPGGMRLQIIYPLPGLPERTERAPVLSPGMVEICAALSDPLRVRILAFLRQRALSTQELAGFLELGEPLVSRHLQRMLKAGLVERRRKGYFVLYRLRRDGLAQLSRALEAF